MMKLLLLLLLASSAHAYQNIQPQDISFSSPSLQGVSLGTTTPPTTPLTVYGIIGSSGTSAASVTCSAGTPVLLPNSNSQSGSFTAGSLSTNCTVTFATAWKTAPTFCACNTGTTLYADGTCTKTTITCTAATALTGDTITYFLWGPP
jgi:hypothetical protein